MLVDLLASDTVTRPTPGMRAAMADADVGDDVYAEDPTIRRLEKTVADCSATKLPCSRRRAPWLTRSRCGSCVRRRPSCSVTPMRTSSPTRARAPRSTAASRPDDSVDAWAARSVAVTKQLRISGYHAVVTQAVAVEDTHNRGGGFIYPLARLQALRAIADDNDIALHCDGARIWNAHVATGTPLSSYGDICATLSVCLSKGLGAPVARWSCAAPNTGPKPACCAPARRWLAAGGHPRGGRAVCTRAPRAAPRRRPPARCSYCGSTGHRPLDRRHEHRACRRRRLTPGDCAVPSRRRARDSVHAEAASTGHASRRRRRRDRLRGQGRRESLH